MQTTPLSGMEPHKLPSMHSPPKLLPKHPFSSSGALGCALAWLALASCGAGDPEPAASGSQRAEFLSIAKRVRRSSNEFLGGESLPALRERLKSMDQDLDARLQAEMDLCLELLKVGELEEAKSQVDASIEWVSQGARGLDASAKLPGLQRLRGIVYLRESERENCIALHNPACCIFPLEGAALHVVKQPAQEALASFLRYLELKPADMEVRWLLNIAGLALGDQTGLVPAEFLIDAHAMDENSSVGRFIDVGQQCGVDAFNLCGGSMLEDFDGDGLLDIASSTYDLEGPMSLHLNLGDGSFADRSEPSGLTDQLGGLNCIAADYDNDGDADILVLRGAWLLDQGQIRNSLLRNDGHGVFVDVTRKAGLAEPARPTQAAVFADLDGDGDLDLYVVNESRREMEGLQGGPGDYPSQLFINDGQGVFRDLAESAGVTNDRYGKGVSAGDYDNDGDIDLYVSNVGPNRLYRNDGSGRFTDVAAELGVDAPKRSFATWFFDFNNDGWLDIFVGGYRTKLWHLASDYLGLPHRGTTPRLFLNDGAGGFKNITRSAGLDHAWLPMGANFGDVDGDGWLDVYLATGDPAFETLMPNVLLRNVNGKSFENATGAAGLGHLQKGHGVAFGDLDNDGDQDLYHQLGGFYPDDKYSNALFLNPGHASNAITIKLEGEHSNRQGSGARIKVLLENKDGSVREIHRAAGSVSSFGGSPSRLQIGIGSATKIKRLEVYWPNSDTRQVFEDLEANRFFLVREGAEEPAILPAQSFKIAPRENK